MRALVYYVVGGAPEYAALLRASVASLRRHHPPCEVDVAVDVAVLCDADYARCLADVPARVCRTPPNADPVQASARKMQVFQLVPDIQAYDVVLYLDCDVLVLGRLDGLLRAVSKSDKPDALYTCREGGPAAHAHRYWSLGAYTDDQLAAFEREDVGVFNCGQFAFRPTPRVAAHFAAVCRLIDDDPQRRGFWEQAYANHHFNLARAVDDTVLDDTVLTPLVKLAARRPPAPPGVLLAHFSCATLPWHEKLHLMQAWRCA